MSPRFLIVRRTNPSRGYYKNRDVLELPPGDHHVTVDEDGTVTAVPMRRLTTIDAEGCGALVWDDTFDSDTDTAWTDAPVEDQP